LIVRALFTLIIIFFVYKMYQRLFQQKRCTACGKIIYREAAICHHCNTVQNGVELVQAKVETARTVMGNREGRNGRNFQVMFFLICAIAMIVLSVGLAVWVMQN